MNTPMRMAPSHRSKWYQNGIPVDVLMKKRLRNRNTPLTSEQHASLKSMGITATTEQEAAKIAKRICKYHYTTERPVRKAKPRHISKREHAANVLLHASENTEYTETRINEETGEFVTTKWVGSHNAKKKLATGKY